MPYILSFISSGWRGHLLLKKKKKKFLPFHWISMMNGFLLSPACVSFLTLSLRTNDIWLHPFSPPVQIWSKYAMLSFVAFFFFHFLPFSLEMYRLWAPNISPSHSICLCMCEPFMVIAYQSLSKWPPSHCLSMCVRADVSILLSDVWSASKGKKPGFFLFW